VSPLPVPSPPPEADLPLIGRIDDPRVAGLVLAGLIVGASYVFAHLVAYILGRLLMARARRTGTDEDNDLVRSLKRPVIAAIVLLGAAVAAAALPLAETWEVRLIRTLFALFVAATTVALVRAWKLTLFWWSRDPKSNEEKDWARDFSPLLTKVGALLIALFGLITILENVGVDVNSLVVSLGVGSLAVGLAAQDTLANMFAGFTLLLDRPFRIGERIQLASGEIGDVETIGIRATHIRNFDESLLVVPNSVLTKEKVLNLSRPSRTITTRLTVGVAYDSDLGQVKQILKESALVSSRIDRDREPRVLVLGFGDAAVNFRLVFWVKDYTEQAQATSEVYEEIYRRLAEAGIDMPLPTRRVIQETPGVEDAE